MRSDDAVAQGGGSLGTDAFAGDDRFRAIEGLSDATGGAFERSAEGDGCVEFAIEDGDHFDDAGSMGQHCCARGQRDACDRNVRRAAEQI